MPFLPVAAFIFLILELGGLTWLFATSPPPSGSPLSVLLGWGGLGSMVIMLIYSVARRSRALRRRFRLSAWLNFHIFFGLQGVLLVFFHCWPIFFPEGPRDYNFLNAGRLTLVAVGVVFCSGLFGRYLIGRLPRTLRGEALGPRELETEMATLDKGIPAPVAALWAEGDWGGAAAAVAALADLEEADRERALRRIDLGRRHAGLAAAQRFFSRWIVAHRPMAAILYILAGLHVVASFYLSEMVVLAALALMAISLIWSIVAGVKQRAAEEAAREAHELAVSRGAQPASLHPKIDLDVCVGSGACAAVCPEKDVIAVISGKARVVNPTNCIGHGECMAACPVDAISLVIGSERRGVDIPVVGGDFQTSVPGLYIVGELGGMGLIYNAVTQGLQCLAQATKAAPLPKVEGAHQLAIVGAGPAGLAASVAAIDAGLDFVTLDQEDAGGTILQYPRRKIVMTRPFELPIYGRVMLNEVSKESLLELWQDVMAKTGLTVRTGCKVESVTKGEDGIFQLETSQGSVRAQRVVLAIGRRGSPRKLGVPGEDSGKVAYRLLEPDDYAGTRCLVVGGGDAAVEAAVALGQAGATTHLSYRRDSFGRIKPKNQAAVDAAVEAGKVTLVMQSTATEILPEAVILDVDGTPTTLENDFVFVFAGGVLPTAFLEAAGVEVRTFKGEEFAPANA
jgi:thioredoxin reductase (NADPH)